MEKCVEATIEYTKDRQAFGKSILDNQYVHYRLAELQTEIEALRALTYRATGMYIRLIFLTVIDRRIQCVESSVIKVFLFIV